MNLDVNEDCKYLQTIPYSMLMQAGFKEYEKAGQDSIDLFNSDQMITASICGGTSLKIRAFDLHPDLLLNRTFIKNLMVSTEKTYQPILITSNNAYVNSTAFTLYLSIADSIRNESGSIDSVMVVLFFVVFPLIMVGLVMMLNRKVGKSKEKPKEQVNRLDSMTSSSEFISTESNSKFKSDESSI